MRVWINLLAFFVAGSSTVATRRLISLRIAFAETPVVAVLKSIWLVPLTRALNESVRGMRLLLDIISLFAVEISMRAGELWVLVRGAGARVFLC
jgi:hypothetical protein